MEFSSRQFEDVTLIQVEGRIDHKTAKVFENAFKPHVDACLAGEYQKIEKRLLQAPGLSAQPAMFPDRKRIGASTTVGMV